jgi:hypothetical protein
MTVYTKLKTPTTHIICYLEIFNPWLNLHHPGLLATEITSPLHDLAFIGAQ